MSARSPEIGGVVERALRVGVEVARPAADDVDRSARFPSEAIAALRAERLLGAAIPAELGGLGLSVAGVAQICEALGQHCASTAMIFAMHQIQIACLARHGMEVAFFRAFLAGAAEHQLLVASATSEVGIGGDLRASACAIVREGACFTLRKRAPVISYGEHADAILVTARRAPDAAPSDQALALVLSRACRLTRLSAWDTLGMRGTCSPGFELHAEGTIEQILPAPFGDIAAQTMVPYSHVVWSSCWLGIATDAVTRAHAFVREGARRRQGEPPFGGRRLARAAALLQTMRAGVHGAAREHARLASTAGGAELLGTIGHGIETNNLKITSSDLVIQIVQEALAVCGMAGYANEGPFSMGRQLRDAHSAALMIANDRILATNASLLLVHKDL